MSMQITFWGAAGTVTGSRHLVETDKHRYLLDCGLFQGVKNLRQRNWAPFQVPPASIDAVILSHAHLDHTGYLPRLVRNGFAGPVYSSAATRDLADILLADSAHLQEADAEYLNRHKLSRHQPALPLYTMRDAAEAMRRFRLLHNHEPHALDEHTRVRLHRAGHILGANVVELEHRGKRLVYSGDLGRLDDPLMYAPDTVADAHWLVVESTYGNREHVESDVQSELADIINRTAARGGTVVIPAFAVGRSQLMLYYLWQLRLQQRLPSNLPVFLDSPMALRAVEVYSRHSDEQRLIDREIRDLYQQVHFVSSVEESKALNTVAMPKIIVSASGMATGGRVLHHLKHYVGDPRNTVLFAGFQAPGTRGAVMLDGARQVKIHGEYFPVRAEVLGLSGLSAHADVNEILTWLRGFRQPPERTFIVHGEPAAADALRLQIQDTLGWRCEVPEHGQSFALD